MLSIGKLNYFQLIFRLPIFIISSMLQPMTKTTKDKGTRIGFLVKENDKALIARIQDKLETPLGKPSVAVVLRSGLLALAAREKIK